MKPVCLQKPRAPRLATATPARIVHAAAAALAILAASAALPAAQVATPVPEVAPAGAPAGPAATYQLQPGDLLTISVWKEKDLQLEVLVRSDGWISFPLAGEVQAAGQTVDAVRTTIVHRLQRYIPDPVVTVAVKAIGGNHIYVIGKVSRPGEYPFVRPVDVLQALSLAGGTTPYAALNDIVILRRDTLGQQRVMHFRYADIERGRALDQNVVLESGDTVVVP